MADGARPFEGDSDKQTVDADEDIQDNLAGWERKPGVLNRLRGLLKPDRAQVNLSEALRDGEDIADLSLARRDMIERVIAFDSKQVVDVMIPRADIISVERNVSLTELLNIFSEAGHSRLPVYRGELDDPIGMVHIRDLVGVLADPAGNDARTDQSILDQLVRKILYVPPSMPITDLLLRMQANRIHMALVIDEFGGTDGLVTIEDLVEEIVGDIQDEHDEEEDVFLKRLSPQVWEANARLPLEELERATGIKIELDEDDVDTLGGLVFTLAGRVPLRGEVICDPAGLEFEVLDADPRRIRKIKLRTLQEHELVNQATEPVANGK